MTRLVLKNSVMLRCEPRRYATRNKIAWAASLEARTPRFYYFPSLRLRMASVRRRKALSLIKPCASF